jgi:uncharacterized protein
MVKETISKELFDILACPECKLELIYNENKTGLICEACDKIYRIKEGIPIFV